MVSGGFMATVQKIISSIVSSISLPFVIGTAIIIVISWIITVVAFHHGKEETAGGGSVFVNVLWLSIGMGLPLILIFLLFGSLMCILPATRKNGRSLFRGAKYICAPAEFKLHRSRSFQPVGSDWGWLVVFGAWLGILEFVLGGLYCCTLVGIHFGLKHIKLGKLMLFPRSYRLMSLYEYEEFHAARMSEGWR